MTLSCQMNGRCVSALMQSVSLPLLPQTVLREFPDKLTKLGTPTTPEYSRRWIQISPGSTFCDSVKTCIVEYISYQELTEAEQPWIGGAVRHDLFSLLQPLLSTMFRPGGGKEVEPGHFSIYKLL